MRVITLTTDFLFCKIKKGEKGAKRMAKQLNVNLAFTADTGKAKAQLQSLQNQLQSLIYLDQNSLVLHLFLQ